MKTWSESLILSRPGDGGVWNAPPACAASEATMAALKGRRVALCLLAEDAIWGLVALLLELFDKLGEGYVLVTEGHVGFIQRWVSWTRLRWHSLHPIVLECARSRP